MVRGGSGLHGKKFNFEFGDELSILLVMKSSIQTMRKIRHTFDFSQ